MAANTQNFRVKYGLNVNSEATIGSNLTVNSVATFANNVSIGGDLTVTGNVAFTTSLQLGTSELLLLKDVSGSPSSNASVTVNRGTSTDVSIRWSETNDKWEFTNDGSVYFPLRTYSDLVYKFSTETNTASDPGAAYVRFNSATLASVTTIAVDLTELSGATLTNFIDFFDDSTSADSKGVILFRSSTAPERYAAFNLTAVTTQTGYRTLTVTHASSTTLFSNDDVVFMSFIRTGDKGQKGERVSNAVFTDANNTTVFTNSDLSTFLITGLKGQKGERINSATYTDANNTTVFTNSDSSTFLITGLKGQKGDKGDKGDKGQKGDLVSSATYTDANNTIVFTNSDASTFLVTGVKGQKGDKGNTGDKGQKGEVGDKGQKGEVGEKGQKGEKISSTSYNDSLNTLTFTYSDATTTTVSGVKGQKGDTGASVKGEPGAAGGFTTDSNARVNSLGVGTSASGSTGRIDATTIYATSFLYTSDINYKYDVNSIQASLEFIKKLNPVTFKFLNSNEPDGGFIAQDILKVIPDAVTDDGSKLSLKYNIIIAHLTRAVQELTEKVERLELRG